MEIEINRIRVTSEGVRFEVFCPNWGSAARAIDELNRIEPAAFAPREPTAPPYSYAESLERRRIACEQGTRIPRAYVPPFTNPGGYLMADVEEPPLRAGGTSSDDED